MIASALRGDVPLMVPADGNSVTVIAEGNREAGEIAGQTRQHSI